MTTPRPADEAAHALLARRARALATMDATAVAAVDALVPALVARRGETAFAVRAADVRDVRRAARVSVLPGAGRHVTGLVAWRGQGIVVHDVFEAGGGGAPMATADWLLVVGERGNELALVADDVDDVVDLRLDTLVAAPDGGPPSLGATPDGLLLLDLRGWLALHPAS